VTGRVHQRGGRFIKVVSEGNSLTSADLEEASAEYTYEKVSHALRSAKPQRGEFGVTSLSFEGLQLATPPWKDRKYRSKSLSGPFVPKLPATKGLAKSTSLSPTPVGVALSPSRSFTWREKSVFNNRLDEVTSYFPTPPISEVPSFYTTAPTSEAQSYFPTLPISEAPNDFTQYKSVQRSSTPAAQPFELGYQDGTNLYDALSQQHQQQYLDDLCNEYHSTSMHDAYVDLDMVPRCDPFRQDEFEQDVQKRQFPEGFGPVPPLPPLTGDYPFQINSDYRPTKKKKQRNRRLRAFAQNTWGETSHDHSNLTPLPPDVTSAIDDVSTIAEPDDHDEMMREILDRKLFDD
jgi:hypothetical protein